MRLASQPQTPPTISKMIIPMSVSLLFRGRPVKRGGRSGITDA
jgi:hypothetical protein